MKNNPTPVTVRRARLADVPQMLAMLDAFARQNEILPRTEDDVYRTIREWAVAATDTRVVGMGSLLVMWHDLAEVRSLVVHANFHGQGVGRRIVETLLAEARTLKIPRVFALTRKPGFFLKLGFDLTKIERLPRKVKRDCVFCPVFHACDEVALITHLNYSAPDKSAVPASASRNGAAPE